MAYEAKGREDVVDVIELSQFSELRITEIHDESDALTSVDIRQWYCTRNDATMKPSKGIRLRADDLDRIISVLSAIKG